MEKLYQREDLHPDLPSIRCVGYRQMWEYLRGDYDHEEMIFRGICATRQLAKRQITWLRGWKTPLNWLDKVYNRNRPKKSYYARLMNILRGKLWRFHFRFRLKNSFNLAKCFAEHFPEMNLDEIIQQIERDATDLTTAIGQINYAISLSDFLEKVLKKHPHFLAQWWQTPPQFSDCQDYTSRLAEQLSTIQNEEQLYKTLRNFRNQEMAKLSFCQSLNLATVEEIFIHLSQLAESLIIGARDWLYKQACEEMGIPCDENGNPQQLYILGMGKLGGFELNFSSDIDLIFTYPSQGESVGARRAVDNAKFFTRLGQRLINALINSRQMALSIVQICVFVLLATAVRLP